MERSERGNQKKKVEERLTERETETRKRVADKGGETVVSHEERHGENHRK